MIAEAPGLEPAGTSLCRTITDAYDTLIAQRRALAAAGSLSPELAGIYTEVTGGILVAGLKAVLAEAVFDMTADVQQWRGSRALAPYGGWRNFPTWAAQAWLLRDPAVAAVASDLIADATDVESASVVLHELVSSALAEDPTLPGADLLSAGLEVADWEEVAASFGFEGLDEQGNNRCTTWGVDL